MNSINKVLREQLEAVKPKKETLADIKKISDKFCSDLQKKLKAKKIDAEIFIGGSLAKDTIIKKNKYDIDIFIRFNKKYGSDKISKILGQMLGKKTKKIHGSRDYYQIFIGGILLEIIPVIKIQKPEQALNVTDLSYFHVNYIKKKENKKLTDEIRLAKVFAHAQGCYGAESYVNGFSGYALELLICHYKNFLKFVQEIAKVKILNKKEKIIIDDSKFYKKNEVLRELNESKIQSPIILIDPTFKERNVMAGLSYNTFFKFQKACLEFLKKPHREFFESKSMSEELKGQFGNKLIIISAKTNRQAGDIAGTKLKKFFGFFISRLKKEFQVQKDEFEYDEDKNTAFYYIVLNKKQDEKIRGPPITALEHLTKFKKAHPNSFIKNHIAYAKISHNLNFKEFLKKFLQKEKRIIKEMDILEIKLV